MNFHPPLSSAPAILLTTGLLLELAGRLSARGTLCFPARVLLVLGSAALGLGYLSGLLAEELLSPEVLVEKRGLLDAHEGWARLSALFSLLPLLFLALLSARREKSGARTLSGVFLLLYIALAVFTDYTSFLGGQLVFDHGVGTLSGS